MANSFKNLVLLVLSISIFACSKEEDPNQTSSTVVDGSGYFPLDSGLTRYYQVDSVYWDAFTGIRDTIRYNLKEVIAGNFLDNQGRQVSRIERFKEDNNGNWIIYKVWSSLRTNTTAETVEDNVRIIKLTFPCTTGESWNGNAYNALGDKNFEFTACNVPGSSLNLNFTNTSIVNQDDEPANLLNDRNDLEKYALHIGMYYRMNAYVEFNFLSGDTISGYIYTEKLTAYTP